MNQTGRREQAAPRRGGVKQHVVFRDLVKPKDWGRNREVDETVGERGRHAVAPWYSCGISDNLYKM